MVGLMLAALGVGRGWSELGTMGAIATASTSPLMWYVTRMSAVAAYVLLTLSVALGMLQTIARRSSEHLTWLVDELHQFLATLAGVLVISHVVSLVLDDFLPFSVANILLPVNEPYLPFGVSLGVFSLYGMVLLLSTSWLRRRIPYRLWRGIHYVSFLTVVLVTAHGLLAGSDARELWMRAIYAAAAGSLGFALLIRVFFSRPAKPRHSAKDVSLENAARVVRPRGRVLDA
jgi:predicted ferric reductase